MRVLRLNLIHEIELSIRLEIPRHYKDVGNLIRGSPPKRHRLFRRDMLPLHGA